MEVNRGQLKKLHLSLMDILKEIDSLCRKNDITYFLIGGTLLGAKRHSGFIPWDDDLDIAMPRNDYEKFEKIANNELSENLYLKNFHTDNNYHLPFGKVCKKGTKYITSYDSIDESINNEIFVDIFPLDYVKKEISVYQKIQGNLIKGLKAVIIRKKGYKVEKPSISVKLLQLIFFPFKAKTLMKLQEKIMIGKGKDDLPYIVNNGSNYSFIKQTMPTEVYFPKGEMKFEGYDFFVPNNVDYILKRIYGENYMELPPEEKRRTHEIIDLKV